MHDLRKGIGPTSQPVENKGLEKTQNNRRAMDEHIPACDTFMTKLEVGHCDEPSSHFINRVQVQNPLSMMNQRAKACSECARLKEKCDRERPCGRCKRLGKSATCVDQTISRKRKRSAIEEEAVKVRSCDRCRRRKKKCIGGAPCENCVRADLASECNARNGSAEKGALVCLTRPVAPNYNYVLNVPKGVLDIPTSINWALANLNNVSPLEIYEALSSKSLMTMTLMLLSSATVFSFPGATSYILQVKNIMEQLSSFVGIEKMKPLIDLLEKFSKVSLSDLRPPQSLVVPPSISVIDSESLNIIPKFHLLSPAEKQEVEYMIEQGGAESLLALPGVKRSQVGTFCLRLDISAPKPNLLSLQFFLNYAAEKLLGYTSQEIKHYLDIRTITRGKDGINPMF
jgi:hypothetical protein